MLFPDLHDRGQPLEIPGLVYRPDYVTAAEEAELVRRIDREPWDTTWERRRQLYGASYGATAADVREIPAWGQALIRRLHEEQLAARPFDQMLVNEYQPGQGIALHHDYRTFDRIVVSLSLLSACVMDFQHSASGEKASLLLERCSLLVLSDAARYEWKHGIARRKKDRWQGAVITRSRRLSITFRLRK